VNSVRRKNLKNTAVVNSNPEREKVLAAAERRGISDISKIFSSGTFYFSYGHDLTNTLQRRYSKDKTMNPIQMLEKQFWVKTELEHTFPHPQPRTLRNVSI